VPHPAVRGGARGPGARAAHAAPACGVARKGRGASVALSFGCCFTDTARGPWCPSVWSVICSVEVAIGVQRAVVRVAQADRVRLDIEAASLHAVPLVGCAIVGHRPVISSCCSPMSTHPVRTAATTRQPRPTPPPPPSPLPRRRREFKAPPHRVDDHRHEGVHGYHLLHGRRRNGGHGREPRADGRRGREAVGHAERRCHRPRHGRWWEQQRRVRAGRQQRLHGQEAGEGFGNDVIKSRPVAPLWMALEGLCCPPPLPALAPSTRHRTCCSVWQGKATAAA